MQDEMIGFLDELKKIIDFCYQKPFNSVERKKIVSEIRLIEGLFLLIDLGNTKKESFKELCEIWENDPIVLLVLNTTCDDFKKAYNEKLNKLPENWS